MSSVGVLGGISDKDKFFNEDIHPEDMEFEIKNVGDRFNDEVSQEFYIKYLTATSSHVIEHNIPGKRTSLVSSRKEYGKIMGSFDLDHPLLTLNLETIG